jgi:23S rRNA pseudouridine1911/1915/1917 synthase
MRYDTRSQPMSVPVLYEDNHLIAVFKPAGVLTQHERAGDGCLMDRVKDDLCARHAKPGAAFLGLLHRLDRGVAGVVLFAKTSKGASRLSQQIRDRQLEKVYWAVVEGTPVAAEAELVHHHVLAGDGARVDARPGPGTKPARLRYRIQRRLGARSLLEVTLETGRKHQIRLQLAALGHPIVGDRRYGARTAFPGEGIALVARRLRFRHPTRPDETVSVELPQRLCPLAAAGLLP